MKKTALVIANNHLNIVNGKTAHGLIRFCERYEILGVLDPETAGQDIQSIIPLSQSLPIFATIDEAIEKLGQKPDFCVTGIATHGGQFTEELIEVFHQALDRKISLANGLHQFLTDDEDFLQKARESNLELIDIRKSKPRSELSFWEGHVYEIECPIIAVLGTDCAIGKRTTTRILVEDLKAKGLKVEMIYTGQTGWLQGGDYGFILDSTTNDFVSGELEASLVNCWRKEKPDLILIEGQSSLRNPSGPCGSELLLSGNAKAVVLQHAPGREYFEGYEELKAKIPTLAEEVALIKAYGSEVIGAAINTENLDSWQKTKEKLEEENKIPVSALFEEGSGALISAIEKWMAECR